MKLRKLAVLSLVCALGLTQVTSFNAAETEVKVVKDSSGKVDYKWFYIDNQKVKYEDWNNGKKIQINSYSNGKVDTKTFYNTSGQKTRYEDWSSGNRVQINKYSNGKVDTKTFYNTSGQKTRYEDWSNSKVDAIAKYDQGKLVTLFDYQNGQLDVRSNISGQTVVSYKYKGKQKVWKQTRSNGKYKCYNYSSGNTKNAMCYSQYDYAGARVSVYK